MPRLILRLTKAEQLGLFSFRPKLRISSPGSKGPTKKTSIKAHVRQTQTGPTLVHQHQRTVATAKPHPKVEDAPPEEPEELADLIDALA